MSTIRPTVYGRVVRNTLLLVLTVWVAGLVTAGYVLFLSGGFEWDSMR